MFLYELAWQQNMVMCLAVHQRVLQLLPSQPQVNTKQLLMIHFNHVTNVIGPLVPPGQLSTLVINMSTILLSWQCTDEHKISYVIFCHDHNDPTIFWDHNVTTCYHLEQGDKRSNNFACRVASYNEVYIGPFSKSVNITLEYDGMLLYYNM